MPDAALNKATTALEIPQSAAIRLPLPGVVSILHRVSGAVLFLFAAAAALPAATAACLRRRVRGDQATHRRIRS